VFYSPANIVSRFLFCSALLSRSCSLFFDNLLILFKIFPISQIVPGESRVYVGSTGNFSNRKSVHKHNYKTKPDLLVYSAMRLNGGFENYKFETVARFDSNSYPEGGARRLAIEMEGALIRELGVVSGCLNSQVAGRTQKERYDKDPEFRQLCVLRSREYRKTVDLEKYRAAGKVRAAASYARQRAARLALLANAPTPVKKLD
jgi:hypothetical protein